MSALTISAVLAPFFGGLIQQYFNWQANFIVLFAWMLFVCFITIFVFKETSKHHGKHRLNIPFVAKAYWSLLKTNNLSVIASFFYLWRIICLVNSRAYYLMHKFHVSAGHYGSLMILTALSTGISGIIGGKLAKRISPISILKIGLITMIISGALLLSINAMHQTNIS